MAQREQIREPQAERRTLRALLVGRLVAALVLLGSATVARVRSPEPDGTDALFLLLALTFALSVVYAALLRVAPRHRRLVDIQLAADSAVVSAAVLLTGGLQSLLVPLYVLPVVGAAVVQYRRGGLIVASLNTLLYGLIIGVQYGFVGPAGRPPVPGLAHAALPPFRDALATLALNGGGFACVAWLTGYLAERVRSTDERLREASTIIADLQAFNECVIQSLTGGLATTDLDGRVLTFNAAGEQITGWRAADVRGRPVEQVLQLPADLIGSLHRMVESGRGRRLDLVYTTAGGRAADLGVTAAPLMGAAGRVGFLFTFQDITDRKRREREAQTEHRLAAIGEMAAGIAHEIRNPLASMAGSIQLLRQDLQLSPEQAQLMDIVLRESRRLNETIRNFLAYARPERAHGHPVDLVRIVREAAVLLQNSSERRPNHEVAATAGATTCLIEGDEAQVRQVVWNLATNGLKAMPGGGRLELRVGSGADGRAMLSVRDEGVGIAPADLDRVFEPFRSTFPGGTGLGLSIVHRIVSAAGGAIDVESAPGAGTTVRVLWPRAAGPGAAITALSA
jgi:two-component system sensor histidine kinase PilS (NtrC family)